MRILPSRKDREINFTAPKIGQPSDVPAAMAAVFDAVTSGEITPAEGLTMAGIVEKVRSALELAAIERRITLLEARSAHPVGDHV